jgi:3-hydroxyacyl-CoA dehydrogenase
MSNVIEFEQRGAIAVLTINNPPANALSFAVCKALGELIPRCMADDAITGIVLTGAGRMFMAGADIREFNLQRP